MKKFFERLARKLLVFTFQSDYLTFVTLHEKLVDRELELNNLICKLQTEHSSIIESEKRFRNLVDSAGLSVDVHEHQLSRNWAVFHLEGQKELYMKFIDLGHQDLRKVISFMRQFENVNFDASPQTTRIIRAEMSQRSF